jgi:hypothetical protein
MLAVTKETVFCIFPDLTAENRRSGSRILLKNQALTSRPSRHCYREITAIIVAAGLRHPY